MLSIDSSRLPLDVHRAAAARSGAAAVGGVDGTELNARSRDGLVLRTGRGRGPQKLQRELSVASCCQRGPAAAMLRHGGSNASLVHTLGCSVPSDVGKCYPVGAAEQRPIIVSSTSLLVACTHRVRHRRPSTQNCYHRVSDMHDLVCALPPARKSKLRGPPQICNHSQDAGRPQPATSVTDGCTAMSMQRRRSRARRCSSRRSRCIRSCINHGIDRHRLRMSNELACNLAL